MKPFAALASIAAPFLATACMMPPDYGPPPAAPTLTGAPAASASPPPARPEGARLAAAPEDATTRHYSLSLHNSCRKTVKLFIGEKPPFSSGTNTTLGSNTTSSYSGTAPETIWVVDDAGKPVSSYTARPGMQTMQILESCGGFSTY